MADPVRALEVEDHQVGMVAVVEVARDPLLHARGPDDGAQRHHRILERTALRARRGDLGRRHVEVLREVFVRNAAVARDDRLDAGRERRGIGDAGARQALEEDRARVVGDEEALDLFRRVRRPPAHDADGAPLRRGDVPDGRHGARVARDRLLLPADDVDLLEVEDAVHVRADAGRDRRPDDRREDRHEARQPRRVALGRQPFPVRHLALGGEPVEEIPVEAVEPEPDDRSAASRRAAGTRRVVGVLDSLRGRGAARGRSRRRGRGRRRRALRPAPACRREHGRRRHGRHQEEDVSACPPPPSGARQRRAPPAGFGGASASSAEMYFSAVPASPVSWAPRKKKAGVP